MNASQLENNFLAMEEDFDAILASSKKSLKKDKEDLEKSALRSLSRQNGRPAIKNEKSHDNVSKRGLSFNLGGFEKETPKQRQLREERQREYRDYIAEQTYRTNGLRATTKTTDDMESSRNLQQPSSMKKSVASTKQEFRNKIDQEYEDLLKRKQKEEKQYRLQFDGANSQEENNSGKKVIVFDSDDDELYQFVKKQKQSMRGKSAESHKRLEVPRTMKTEGRSNSVPPSVPPIFGGSSHTGLKKERQEEYKRALEDQIKEKELLKAKDKLKRLGRITSDVDVTEIEIPKNDKDKWALPVRKTDKMDNSYRAHLETYNDEQDTSFLKNSTSRHNMHNPQQFQQQPMMQQAFYPQTQPGVVPMYQPMVMNPVLAWQNMMQPPPAQAGGGAGAFNGANYPDMMNGDAPPRTSGRLSARSGRKQWQEKVPPLELDDTPNEMGDNYTVSEKKNPLSNLPTRPNMQPPGGGTHGVFNLSSKTDDDAAAKRAKQQAYQEELQKQVQLKKEKEAKEKEEYERYQRKLEAEIEVYDPWGRGGCGALVRNKDGKVVANLKSLQNTDNAPDHKPSKLHYNQQQEPERTYEQDVDDSPILRALAESLNKVGFIDTYKAAVAESSNGASKMKAAAGATYGRGAALKELKGIGAKSPRDKEEQDEYKQFLKEQVEAKKKKEEEAKEKARLEEEKEAKRIAEQQKRMQEEYEREKEQQRQKEEEVRKKNEELRLAAEKKRFEEEQRKKKIEEEYQADLRRQAEMKFEHHNTDEPVENIRSDSPPVPAVAKERRRSEDAQKLKEATEHLKHSQQVHAAQRRQVVHQPDMEYLETIRQSMDHQAKVNETNFQQQKQLISQLSALREQLQMQEMKIQEELHNNKVKYTELNKESIRGKPRPNDIFAKATKKTSKRNNIVENSSTDFHYEQQHPDVVPTSTYKVLDLQQQEYMRQQEERLNNLKKNLHQKHPPPPIQSRGSAKSLLDSNSKFISLRDHQDITSEIACDDTKNMRYSSARSRRREKEKKDKDVNDIFQEYFPKAKEPDSVSIATYRVEEIAKKNEQRLRQYNVDHQDNEAEDIVRDFMHTSDRNRREPSLPSDSHFR